MQAPDAVQFAGPLMKLQTDVLDQIHGGKHGQQPQQGAPAGGLPPGGPPGGGGGPSPMSPSGGGLAGMMGAGQGPSQAVSGGGGSSLSGMDPEQMRPAGALVGAGQ